MVAGALVTGGVLMAWLVRPAMQTVHDVPNSLVGGLQAAQGLTVDPTRTYAEHSLVWMSWYLGPLTMVAAAIGAGVVIWRVLLRRDPAAIVLTLFLAFGGLLYLWRPSISPDQIWVMRRYVPLVLPALLLLAAAAFDAVVGWPRLERVGGPARVALGCAAAGVLIVPPLMTVKPVPRLAEQAGYLDGLEAVCQRIGPDGVAVVAGPWAVLTLPQAIRSWCGVPAAALTSSATAADVVELAGRWVEECRPLVLVTANEPTVAPLLAVAAPADPAARLVNPYLMERVVERRPERYAGESVTLTASPVVVDQTCPPG
jgi:hypothetical protein